MKITFEIHHSCLWKQIVIDLNTPLTTKYILSYVIKINIEFMNYIIGKFLLWFVSFKCIGVFNTVLYIYDVVCVCVCSDAECSSVGCVYTGYTKFVCHSMAECCLCIDAMGISEWVYMVRLVSMLYVWLCLCVRESLIFLYSCVKTIVNQTYLQFSFIYYFIFKIVFEISYPLTTFLNSNTSNQCFHIYT